MNVFGLGSRRELSTCDFRLQQLAHRVLPIKDHSVVKGHRPEDEQNDAFREGHSELPWPDGKHNGIPSKAMDVRTYPVPANESDLREEQLYLLGMYKGVAAELGIPVRTGGDWDRDGEIADNNFDDFFHIEIDE